MEASKGRDQKFASWDVKRDLSMKSATGILGCFFGIFRGKFRRVGLESHLYIYIHIHIYTERSLPDPEYVSEIGCSQRRTGFRHSSKLR